MKFISSYKLPIILVVVLLLLGVLAYFDEWKSKKDSQSEISANKLSLLKVDDIVELIYFDKTDSKTTEFHLKKDADSGVWQAVSPVIQGALDQESISTFIAPILDYKYDQKIDKPDSLESFGLKTPKRTIKLKSKDGSEISYFIGDNAPVGFSTYVKLSNSDTVYVGSQYITNSTVKELKELRDKVLVKIEDDKLSRILLKPAKGQVIELSKVSGEFKITKPVSVDVDAQAVEDFVGAFNSVRINDFKDTPSKAEIANFNKNDLGAVTFVYSVEGDNSVKEEKKIIYFSSAKDVTLASYDTTKLIVLLPSSFKNNLTKTAKDFEPKKLEKDDEAATPLK